MFSSIAPFHPLEISLMLHDIQRRISLNEQYTEIIVEEADQGRIDRISKRVYGSTAYTWVLAKFSGVQSINQLLPVGQTLRLPSIANIQKALQKERTSAIPVFEYIATQEELDWLQGIGADGNTGTGSSSGSNGVEVIAVSPIYKGQPLIINEDGKAEPAENNGANYRVVGVADADTEIEEEVSYLINGKIDITNWAPLLNDGDIAPAQGDLIWLAETGSGKITTITPQTPNKYAVRLGTMQTVNTLLINISQPIGL